MPLLAEIAQHDVSHEVRNEAINRIMVMSLIHKKLYQETEMAHIKIKNYLEDLSIDVINISCTKSIVTL